ncbi:MAG: AsmA-like C-terminal region-containing protein [Wolbachia sp.]|uniref:AsmA-like C-terminal region-containing protein n=1 Tax=unclassified Wolbachia TaxID=2640676 RepID=UPI00222F81AD|nr:AsmA-like C-terminal region-containing protein [Wolbachia endosymbiont (group A) of Calamotropha paludella]
MRLSLYAILSISLLLILMHVAATFKDWSGYRKYIIKELEKTYDAKVHIGGKIKVSLITPKLTIYNVYVQYNENKEQKLSDLISVRKIEIRPSFLSLFLFSLQPKSITLFGMKSNKENLLNIINTNASGNTVDIVIKDSQVSFKNDFADIVNIKEVAVKKNKQFFGKVKVGDNNYDFSGKVNITKRNVHISVESNFVNLLFTGNRNQEELQGNLTLTINNSSGSVSDLAKIINLSFLSCVIPSENIKISSNISLNESEFTATDLKIDSKSMQASGTIQNDRKGNHTNFNISFSKVDLDSIQNDSQRTMNMKDLLECFRAVVPKNLSLNFNMEASNIQYQNKILDNFRAVLKSTDGKVKVNTLLKFPGINNISYLSGEISNNNVLSEFNGDLLVEGNDFESFISCFFPSIKMKENQKNQFTLSSKLHLAPRILSISDIRLLNNKESLQGSIRVSHTKKHNVVNGEFSMHNLDADKYDHSLFSSLPKMQWLKNFQYDANIKARVNNLTLNDTKIKNLDFLLKMEKGKLVADKIKLSGEDFDITGNAKILADQKYAKPLLDVNLTGSKFNGNIFKLPNLVETKRNSRNEIDQIQWSTKQLDFLDDKEGFDANVQINTAEFKTEQNVLKDFNLDAVMRNNTITIRQASYVLEHGQVFFQGYLRSDSINTRFSIVNLDTKKIGKVIGIDNVNGQVSLNGEIKTQGKSFHDWASNLSGDVNLQAQGIEVTNVDFNSFITNLLSSKNKSEISTLAYVDIYNGKTSFENISGKASIKSGICSTSLQFGIDQASGSISSNLTLSNFALASIFRFFFIPPNYSNPIYIDMHLDSPIWRPKMSFDVDQIFTALVGKKNS